MKYSKVIALSAVSAAFAVVLLALGSFIEVIDITCIMFAGIAVMLPLAKEYYLGAFLSFLSSALLGFIIGGAKVTVIVPYAVFFGVYPIVNALQVKYKVNKILALIVKDIWFLLSMFLYYKLLVWFTGYDLFADFSFIPESLKKFLVPGLFVFGALIFVLYDIVMLRMQVAVRYLVEKLKL